MCRYCHRGCWKSFWYQKKKDIALCRIYLEDGTFNLKLACLKSPVSVFAAKNKIKTSSLISWSCASQKVIIAFVSISDFNLIFSNLKIKWNERRKLCFWQGAKIQPQISLACPISQNITYPCCSLFYFVSIIPMSLLDGLINAGDLETKHITKVKYFGKVSVS